MFESILSKIQAYNTIIIHRHSKPDGDALGSQIGLKHILKENFPEKTVYTVGDAAGHYSFMTDSVMDTLSDDVFPSALSIILDCGSPSMICDERYRHAAATVRIDHHLFCGQIADVEVIDSTFESCCGMIVQFALEAGLHLTPIAARSLYTGMVTDSGRFRYDSTTSRTLRLAAILLEQPFDPNDIYADLYADTYENKKLKAQFILKVQFTPANVAYIYTTQKELEELGMESARVSRGMVGTMADMKGVDIWVNFTETEAGVLCELRSGRYNINPIAVKYGGGGHAKASGAMVPDRATAMNMLNDLDAMQAAMKED